MLEYVWTADVGACGELWLTFFFFFFGSFYISRSIFTLNKPAQNQHESKNVTHLNFHSNIMTLKLYFSNLLLAVVLLFRRRRRR